MSIISVPATSANLGPGFDSIGIALDWRLRLTIGEPTEHWQIQHPFGPDVPTDQRNLIIKTALDLAPDLAPHQLTVASEIPLARGLGSSSTAIVAGLALANEIGHLGLAKEALLARATELEGHPDNVAPAIFGGLVVATYDGKQVQHVSLPLSGLTASVYVPHEQLLTSTSRSILPSELPFKQAIAGSSVANVLVAALATGNWAVALPMLEQDHFHEQYRASLVPALTTIREQAHQLGFTGTYLSGAGPTVITLGSTGNLNQLQATLRNQMLGDWHLLAIDQAGLQVTEK